ncbi:772_t:CDS:2 [Cetraspora pellucida]|uniref:772_t:CDS:1 n=1 Tax=Cetraspora pellucida TaxID=1433469 RepID=A0ACA9KP68_9GLOM|nr:772_t:CDS:2 [Cetraspora pellucida]
MKFSLVFSNKSFTVLLVEDIAAIQPRDIMNCIHSEVGAETSYMGA